MSDTTTYRAISVKLAAFLCREKWSDELPEKTREEMQRLVKEWQDVDRDHKASDATTELPGEAISPGLVKHYKHAAHRIGDLFTWCVEHMRGMQFGPDSSDWIDQIKNRLLTFATLQSDCERWSAMYAKQADELVAVKWERDKFKRIDECNQGTIELAIRRAEAAEQRVKEIQAAWNRVAGFAVSESCGPENRFRITIDYPTLEKLQDAYRAMHDITTAIATTPPADGAQSS